MVAEGAQQKARGGVVVDPRSVSTRRLAQAEAALRLAGFSAPPWTALADGLAAGEASHFGDVARGWPGSLSQPGSAGL